jgi:hypothetical protein
MQGARICQTLSFAKNASAGPQVGFLAFMGKATLADVVNLLRGSHPQDSAQDRRKTTGSGIRGLESLLLAS